MGNYFFTEQEIANFKKEHPDQKLPLSDGQKEFISNQINYYMPSFNVKTNRKDLANNMFQKFFAAKQEHTILRKQKGLVDLDVGEKRVLEEYGINTNAPDNGYNELNEREHKASVNYGALYIAASRALKKRTFLQRLNIFRTIKEDIQLKKIKDEIKFQLGMDSKRFNQMIQKWENGAADYIAKKYENKISSQLNKEKKEEKLEFTEEEKKQIMEADKALNKIATESSKAMQNDLKNQEVEEQLDSIKLGEDTQLNNSNVDLSQVQNTKEDKVINLETNI